MQRRREKKIDDNRERAKGCEERLWRESKRCHVNQAATRGDHDAQDVEPAAVPLRRPSLEVEAGRVGCGGETGERDANEGR